MTYETLNTTLTNGNLDQFLVFTSNNMPQFPLYLLLFIMFSIAGSTYFGTKKFLGEPSIMASLVAGSLTASLVGTIMTMQYGIISNLYLIYFWVITIIFIIFYVFNKD